MFLLGLPFGGDDQADVLLMLLHSGREFMNPILELCHISTGRVTRIGARQSMLRLSLCANPSLVYDLRRLPGD